MITEDNRPPCLGVYGSFHGVPTKCSPAAGCGLKGCPWQRPQDKPTDTVYAHVERTVHALLDAIATALPTCMDPDIPGLTPDGVKILAEAVQALSSWPQFNPRDAHEQYQKLAEYEVEKAVKFKLDNLRDVADELEKKLHAAVAR